MTPDSGAQRSSAFTWKSIGAGLLGSLAIALLVNFNDNVLRQTPLIGNHLPVAPFAILLVLGVIWNPIMGWWVPRLRFAPGELTVTMVLLLVCCWLPTSGFFRYFHRGLILPSVVQDARPAWDQLGTLDEVPERLMPLHGDPRREARVRALEEGVVMDPLHRQVLESLDVRAFGPMPTAEVLPQILARTQRSFERQGGGIDLARARALLEQGLPPTGAGAWSQDWAAFQAAYARHLPVAQASYDTVYGKFLQGMPEGDDSIGLTELPWGPWLEVAAVWGPLIVVFMAVILSLSLVVHRQWSRHEQLSYPLATITTALIDRRPGELTAAIFSNRLLWWGLVPVVVLHLFGYLAAWFPGRVPAVPTAFTMGNELREIFPVLRSVIDPGVTSSTIYFTIIGIAYFISAEMSLSLGISNMVLLLLAVGTFSHSGVQPDHESLRTGAYLMYAAVLIFVGRSYYLAVLRRACGIGAPAFPDDGEQIWAARVLVVSLVGFIALLAGPFGLDWVIATCYALTLFALFLVLTRVVCETGIPFIQAAWFPGSALMSTLGLSALGSAPMVLVMYLSPLLVQDPREALMPYASTGLKVAENTGVRRIPLMGVSFVVMLVALVVGFTAWTWGLYNHGAGQDSWAIQVQNRTLDNATRGLAALEDTGLRSVADQTDGLAKLPLVFDGVRQQGVLGWIVAGAVLVLVTSVLRFTWSWWPLHPVLFVVWGTYPMQCMAWSFLVGWIVKETIVRFAGGRAYQSLKPLFIGLILGEVVAIAGSVGFGFMYHMVTGQLPVRFVILPG